MRFLRKLLVLLLLISLAPLHANAQDLLFEQAPISLEGMATQNISFASTLDVTNDPDEITIPNRAYDNFVLDSNSSLTGLTWSGAYNGTFNPDGSLRSNVDFDVTIYENLPGNIPDVSKVVFSQTYDAGRAAINDGTQVQKAVVPNATSKKGGALLDYTLDLDPINLAAGSYWLSIRAEMDFPSEDFLDPAWAWLSSETGDNLTYNFDEDEDGVGNEPGWRVTSAICASANLAGCDAAFSWFGAESTGGLFGDFDMSGVLDIPDIDLLAGAIRDNATDSKWDVNGDGSLTDDDHAFWISDLKKTLPGDTDFNFKVEFADFLTLSGAFGSPGPNGWGLGNFDTDTDVDFADFLKLSGNFGKVVGEAAGAQSVPEPSTAMLGVSALFTLGLLRRRR